MLYNVATEELGCSTDSEDSWVLLLSDFDEEEEEEEDGIVRTRLYQLMLRTKARAVSHYRASALTGDGLRSSGSVILESISHWWDDPRASQPYNSNTRATRDLNSAESESERVRVRERETKRFERTLGTRPHQAVQANQLDPPLSLSTLPYGWLKHTVNSDAYDRTFSPPPLQPQVLENATFDEC
ncbi:hypothetical protein BDY19DRAFT_907823 [Irpex rosettiformis]|uniref:Uncharacterized protein n=1 Tax=Irpex rosettiformis TaxID=378272 RepID=A0ACB8TY76_9APHY|nr:hypothetical protein BDY19DRAFT_907823 [Irpex rosettiformis]